MHKLYIIYKDVMHVFMHIRVRQNFMNENVARTTFRPHRGYRFPARGFTTITSVSVDVLVQYGLNDNSVRECAQTAQVSPRAEWYGPFHS